MKTTTPIALAALLAVTGCNGGGGTGANGTSMLTRITDVTSDARCPNGGVKIAAGADANGNNTLEDGEVTQSSEICNGAAGANGMNGGNGMNGADGDGGANGMNGSNGATSLVTTTVLPVGNGQCRSGGAQLDFGLDDGASGGIANNGILEAGEIRSTRFICNGLIPYYQGPTGVPAGSVGVYRVRATGGDGISSGGAGGNIRISQSAGTLGGNVKVFKTGAIDAGFAVPAAPAYDPGPVPLTVATDLVLPIYPNQDAGLASADPYFQTSELALEGKVFSNDAGVALEVSSISVAVGRTLTVVGGAATGTLSVRRDIRNAGVITAGVVRTGDSKNLTLQANSFVGLAGSQTKCDGRPGAVGEVGRRAGALTITTNGRISSQGKLSAAGGDGDIGGGTGGDIVIDSSGSDCHFSGGIDASGGFSVSGTGGAGAFITVLCRSISNSGLINAEGARGDFASAGGNVSLTTRLGHLRNSGPIFSRGSGCGTDGRCFGGNAGTITLTSGGGDLISSGALDARGGSGVTLGGNAGAISVIAALSTHFSGVPAGSVRLSGDLLAEGGSGNVGGAAADIIVRVDSLRDPTGQEVELQGYSEVNASGGTGTTSAAGNAGSIVLNTAVTELANGFLQPSGAVINASRLVARGGDGSSAGAGGAIFLSTQVRHFSQPNEQVSNTGVIDVSGGNSGASNGGRGGLISIFGVSRADNRADLIANGGNSSGGPVAGGAGGLVAVRSGLGVAANSGIISVNGGTGSSLGGAGGRMWVEGFGVSNNGNLNANGGNATTLGGNGGGITLTATAGFSTDNAGVLSVAPGTGVTAGQRGTIFVDGLETFQ